MARGRDTTLPAPFLRSVRVLADDALPKGYPFSLGWLSPEFELTFDVPVTILTGENGTGKSTLLEALAALAGFRTSGGGAWGGLPDAADEGPGALAAYLRGGWLPKMQKGWFLKAQSFAAVSSVASGGYLAMSHGEGFAQTILDRMQGQGLYFLDEPEAALSPARQAELLAFLADVQERADAQVIMATHSPILMAVPGARLLRLTHRQIEEVSLRETSHFRLWSAFTADPDAFVEAARSGDLTELK